MKNTLFALNFRKNRDHTVHLLFQVFVLSEIHRNVTIDQTDRIAVIKLNVVRNHIILLKNCGQSYRCIQYRIALDIQLLIHHDTIHLNSVKIWNCHISVLRALYENPVSVKINITVKVSDTSYRFLLFDTDANRITI